jgi:hypothetical protein
MTNVNNNPSFFSAAILGTRNYWAISMDRMRSEPARNACASRMVDGLGHHAPYAIDLLAMNPTKPVSNMTPPVALPTLAPLPYSAQLATQVITPSTMSNAETIFTVRILFPASLVAARGCLDRDLKSEKATFLIGSNHLLWLAQSPQNCLRLSCLPVSKGHIDFATELSLRHLAGCKSITSETNPAPKPNFCYRRAHVKRRTARRSLV